MSADLAGSTSGPPAIPAMTSPSRQRTSILTPHANSAFGRLPDEIIEQILLATDPDSFASLVLLNLKWRRVAQQAHIYAHHLAQCPSYASSHRSFSPLTVTDDDLPRLRRAFAREVKRNLFEAFLRPSETVITIISNSFSASSAPGGEGLQFSASSRGHHLLAYNSSRIYVIDIRGQSPAVKRELKILRRPASACIVDDGSVLAVLSTEVQVDLYDLAVRPPRRTRSILLDHTPRTIALSPCGSVLAAAYEGGIEVSSLNPGALPSDRRAVKCDAVDSLAFSFDGTQLLGTTIQSMPSNTVILTPPYYDPTNPTFDDSMSALWTTSILFPNTSRDCSHAVLLQDTDRDEASWTFTYDRSFETFRAVRIGDLRNGTTYFTGPIPSPDSPGKLLPCTLPAANFHGDLVSAGFQGKDIWLYGVPEDLDAVAAGPAASSPATAAAGVSGSSSDSSARVGGLPQRTPPRGMPEVTGPQVPQWQVLCDKLRHSFVGGCKVTELEGVSMVKWVAGFGGSCSKERLVIAARGVTPQRPIMEEDDMDFVDGGRITLLDFDYGVVDGELSEYTIEVGTQEPEVLEEEQRDLETEVAIVRRRTVAQRRGGARSALLRAATTAARGGAVPLPPHVEPRASRNTTAPTAPSGTDGDDDPLVPRRIGALPPTTTVEPPTPSSEDADSASVMDESEAFDAPYEHASPRSGTTLRRAATAAAMNRRLHPQGSGPDAGRLVYRRADGRREHPHESDADNWVPPPPPYQKEDTVDLPNFLRQASVAPLDMRSGGRQQVPRNVPLRSSTAAPTASSLASRLPPPQASSLSKPLPSLPGPSAEPPASRQPHTEPQRQQQLPPLPPPPGHRRRASGPAMSSRSSRPATRGSIREPSDDLYDVSPPDSPPLMSTALATTGPVLSPRPVSSFELRYHNGPALTNHSPEIFHQRGQAPSLAVHIPAANLMTGLDTRSARLQGNPPIRRLSNAQTWPAGPGGTSGPAPAATNAPHMVQTTHTYETLQDHQARSAGGQWPSSHLDPSVNQRSSQYEAGLLPGNRTSLPHPSEIGVATSGDALRPPSPDQPLIISTPTGVSGAYDAPTRQTSGRRVEMPLFAPVPRYLRGPPGPGPSQPTVVRLETMYGSGPPGTSSGLPPAFLSTIPAATATAVVRLPSVHRRRSRAERSAAKNVRDAKKRGWAGNKGKKKKKKQDDEIESSAAWTDVSTSSAVHHKTDKKCVLM